MAALFAFMHRLFLGLAAAALFWGFNSPNHYPPWTTFHSEFAAAVGIGFLAAMVWLLPAGDDAAARWPAPPGAAVALVVFALVPPLQYAFGLLDFRGDALLGMLYAAGAGLSVWVGHAWAMRCGTAAVFRFLFVLLLFSGIAASALALCQWLRLPPAGWWAMELIDDRPYGNFGQPNHFGLLTVLSLVAVVGLYESRVLRHRWVAALAGTFLLWGTAISGSRASLLALVALTVCWLATAHRAASRFTRSEVIVVFSIGIALCAAVDPLQNWLHVGGTETRVPTDAGPRPLIWAHFWAAAWQRPIWGYGFNQGVAAMADVAAIVQPSRNVVFAHNFLLDWMTWFGIPLALLMTVALVLWLARLFWGRSNPGSALQQRWVFAIVAALLVQSLLEFPYACAFFLLPACLFAGCASALLPGNANRRPTASAGTTAFAAVLGLTLAAMLGMTAVEYFRLEDDFRENRFAKAGFAGAPAFRPSWKPLMLDQLAALNDSAAIDVRPRMPQDQIQLLAKVAHRFHMRSIRIDYARALALNGDLDGARAEMIVVRSVSMPHQWGPIERQWNQWLAEQDRQRRGAP